MNRKGTLLKQAVTVLGLTWPFVIALIGIALTAVMHELSDALAYFLLFASFFGVPIVVHCFFHCLPVRWSDEWRFILALLLAAPVVLFEVYLALIVFGVGYIMVGGYVPA